MKLSVLCIVILGVTITAGLSFDGALNPSTPLEHDLMDFIDLVPAKKVVEIVKQHLIKNGKLYRFFEFLRSSGLHTLIAILEGIPEYVDFREKVQPLGLDIRRTVDAVRNYFADKRFAVSPPPKATSTCCGEKEVNALVTKIVSVLPRNKIITMSLNKMYKSFEFPILISILKRPNVRNIINKLRADKKYQELLSVAAAYGLNIETYMKAMSDVIQRAIGFRY